MKRRTKITLWIMIVATCASAFTILGVKLNEHRQVQGRNFIVVNIKNTSYYGAITAWPGASVSEICQQIGVNDEGTIYRVNGKVKTEISKTAKLTQDTTLSF